MTHKFDNCQPCSKSIKKISFNLLYTQTTNDSRSFSFNSRTSGIFISEMFALRSILTMLIFDVLVQDLFAEKLWFKWALVFKLSKHEVNWYHASSFKLVNVRKRNLWQTDGTLRRGNYAEISQYFIHIHTFTFSISFWRFIFF